MNKPITDCGGQDMNTSFERGAKRSDEWYTPKWIIESLGTFDLDPCAPSNDFYTAKSCYTKADDGLIMPWFGRIWLNPPYKNPIIRSFINKMAIHNNGVALIFNRMDTALWHDIIFPSASAILIIRGRIRFIRPDGTQGDGAGCGSILVAWGEANLQSLRTCGIDGKLINLKPWNHKAV